MQMQSGTRREREGYAETSEHNSQGFEAPNIKVTEYSESTVRLKSKRKAKLKVQSVVIVQDQIF